MHPGIESLEKSSHQIGDSGRSSLSPTKPTLAPHESVMLALFKVVTIIRTFAKVGPRIRSDTFVCPMESH
jgi:hypothetical protein